LLQFSRGTVEFGGEHHHGVLDRLPGRRPQCHSGFYNAYASIKAPLQEALMHALRDAGAGARLFVTGTARVLVKGGNLCDRYDTWSCVCGAYTRGRVCVWGGRMHVFVCVWGGAFTRGFVCVGEGDTRGCVCGGGGGSCVRTCVCDRVRAG
jgi:hypothetical protein